MIQPDEFNLLLSHSPDVFLVAANQGWDLTLAGHTHGGQVTFEFLDPALNPARFYTPFTYGTYRRDARAMYVTRGIGTVGVPARFGAAPELAVIRLVRA
jgi:predicted MPP superfamily phosphohydrolase